MAYSWICDPDRLLSSDDVLYNGGRLDAALFLSYGDRKVRGNGFGTGDRRIFGDACSAWSYDFLDGSCGSSGDCDLLDGVAEWAGENHESHDACASGNYDNSCHKQFYTGGSKRGVKLLSDS